MSEKLPNIMPVGTPTPVFEMVMGESPGKLFSMAYTRMTIGRSDENHIVLDADGVSRSHAVVEQGPSGQWILRDKQSKNGVIINGNRVDHAVLKPGDVIQIGSVVLRFEEIMRAPGEMEAPMVYGDYAAEDEAPPKPKLNKRVLLYGGVALLLAVFYLMSNDGGKKESAVDGVKKPSDFKMGENPDLSNHPGKSLPALEDPSLSKAEVETKRFDWANNPLKESERFFRKGQREYLAKNFSRAIEDFQTTLSLNRGHDLASKYLRLAVYEAETEAKRNWEMGVKYFESLQYQRAIYHFGQVVMLMAHRPTESIVGQSEKYIAIAKRRLEAADLFP